MKFKFTPADFTFGDGDFSIEIAKQANAKLKKWLAAAPTVYLGTNSDFSLPAWQYDRDCIRNVTHRAKLVCIEEIC